MSLGPRVQAPPKTCPACGMVNLLLAPKCKACGHVFWVKRPTHQRQAPGHVFLPRLISLATAVVLGFGVWILVQPGDASRLPQPDAVTIGASPTASPTASPSPS